MKSLLTLLMVPILLIVFLVEDSGNIMCIRTFINIIIICCYIQCSEHAIYNVLEGPIVLAGSRLQHFRILCICCRRAAIISCMPIFVSATQFGISL